jgi:hypothetical protein
LNAGIMHTRFGLTEDGIEQQFAVNHVAHQVLIALQGRPWAGGICLSNDTAVRSLLCSI